jgi:DNA-binding transcriptional regulator LsrR (DeoR family)
MESLSTGDVVPRPKKEFTTEQLLKAARLFYNFGPGSVRPRSDPAYLSREDVAKQMETDGRGLTKLLREARAKAVVKIQFSEIGETALEDRLQTKFGLQKAMVVAGGPVKTAQQLSDLHRRWGGMAAKYFGELWERHPRRKPWHVGVSGGEHVLEFVSAVPERDRDNVHVQVTALIGRGRLPEYASHLDPVVNAGILWSRCGRIPGRCEYATVSPYEPGPKTESVDIEIEKVEKNEMVEEVVRAMDNLDIVFGGIGVQSLSDLPSASLQNRLTMTLLLKSVITREELARQGAVGDFSYCVFDADGTERPKDAKGRVIKNGWRFFLTPGHYDRERQGGVKFFQNMVRRGKTVVGFGGPYKEPAIRAALGAKIINVLLTDEETAKQLVERD